MARRLGTSAVPASCIHLASDVSTSRRNGKSTGGRGGGRGVETYRSRSLTKEEEEGDLEFYFPMNGRRLARGSGGGVFKSST